MVEAGMTGRRSTVMGYGGRPNQKYWKWWTQSLHDKDEIVSETAPLRELLRPQSYENELGNWLLRWFFYRGSTFQGWRLAQWQLLLPVPLKKRDFTQLELIHTTQPGGDVPFYTNIFVLKFYSSSEIQDLIADNWTLLNKKVEKKIYFMSFTVIWLAMVCHPYLFFIMKIQSEI